MIPQNCSAVSTSYAIPRRINRSVGVDSDTGMKVRVTRGLSASATSRLADWYREVGQRPAMTGGKRERSERQKAAARLWNDAMARVLGKSEKAGAARRLANVCTRRAESAEVFEKTRKRVAGTTGLEPATSDVTGRTSCCFMKRILFHVSPLRNRTGVLSATATVGATARYLMGQRLSSLPCSSLTL